MSGLQAQEVAVRLKLLGGTAFNEEAARSAESLKGISKAGQEVNASGGLTGFIGGASKSLDAMSGKLDSFSKKAKRLSHDTAYLSAGAAAGIGFSIKEAVASEGAWKLLETQAGATLKMRKELETASPGFAKYGFDDKETAAAMYPVLSTFKNVNKTLEVTKSASMGAATGMGSLTETAEALSASMRIAFPGIKSANEQMSLLIATAGEGKMRFPELTKLFSTRLFTTAKNAGMHEQDVLALLASVSQTTTGEGTEKFATLFNTALSKTQLLKGAGLAASKALGLGKTGAEDELRSRGGLVKLLEQLNAAKASKGTDTANRLIGEMFGGSRSVSTIEQAMGVVAANKGILGRLDAITPKTNEEKFNATLETMGLKLKVVKADAHDFMVEFGKLFGPPVIHGIEGLTGVLHAGVEGFKALPGPLKDGVGGFIALVAVASPVAFLLSALSRGFSLLLFPVKSLVWVAPRLAAGLVAIGGGAGESAVGVTALTASMRGLAFLTAPVLALTAAWVGLDKVLPKGSRPENLLGGNQPGENLREGEGTVRAWNHAHALALRPLHRGHVTTQQLKHGAELRSWMKDLAERPIHNHVHVSLDGREIAKSVDRVNREHANRR
jgi:hypothetical protein